MNDTYSTYLQSEAWEKKRQQRITLSGGACEACGTKERLQVHHLTYERIFREEMADLMTLCKMHHEAAEEMIQKGAIPRRGCVVDIANQTMAFISPRWKGTPRRDAPKPRALAKKATPLQERRRAKKLARAANLEAIPEEFRGLTRKSKPEAVKARLEKHAEFMAIIHLPRLKYRKAARKIFGKCELRGKIMSCAQKMREAMGYSGQ